jgi:nicotinamidase/pyrazinamidase
MKTILWNVDTQYDFMRPDGALPVPEAESIEPGLEELTTTARGKGYKIVHTADWHNEDSAEFSDEPDYATTFPAHCLADTPGAAYVEATAPKDAYVVDWRDESVDLEAVASAKEVVLYKDAFDVFAGSDHTDTVVETLAPDRAIVYGVATNVCVDYAVRGLLARGVEVVVPTDGIKELPGLPLEETLQGWEDSGAKLSTIDEVVRTL